jgi:uncharacterized repeat protein (TIGR02543 family)
VINTVTAGDTTVTGTGVAGSTITVTFPNDTTATAVVNGNGIWSITNLPTDVTLTAGQTITATQLTLGMTVSPAVSTTVINALTITQPYTGNTTVSGTGAPGYTVTVTLPDGTTYPTTVGVNGAWTVSLPTGTALKYGDTIQATQTDPSGNNTSAVKSVKVINYTNGGSGTSGGGGGGGGGTATTTYTVTYHANNGANEANVVSSGNSSGATITVADNTFTAPTNETFAGWSNSANGAVTYQPGDTFTMPASNVDLYAVWSSNTKPLALNSQDHMAYMSGYPDGTVRPNANISREEVAAIFYRLLTDDSRAQYQSSTTGFSDVPASRWSATAIATLEKAGVLTGYQNGTFRPKDPITRAEFAAIAARFDQSNVTSNSSTQFSDIQGNWAQDSIQRAAGLGWITGFSDGTFRPKQDITRAEAATLINRVLDREPESASDLLSGMKTWKDNSDPSAWYYLAIQEATNSHTYERKSDNSTYETWVKLLP